MKDIHIYGIRNCDTMKKAFQWLDRHQIPYTFHDYKKSGADATVLAQAIEQHGWESVINRKGTSWRALSDQAKTGMTGETALTAAVDNPSLVRRPLMVYDGAVYLGFDEALYATLLKNRIE